MESKWAFLYAFGTCLFVMIVYGFCIYFLTGILVWVSIIGTGIGMLILSLMLSAWVNENYGAHSRIAIEESQANGDENWTGKMF